MPVHNGRPLASLVLLSLFLAVPVRSHAGVRVDEPRPVPALPSFEAPRRSNLQMAVGPAGAVSHEIAGAGSGGGWDATAAIEGVASSEWSWIARCEYARFEHSGSSAVPQAGDLLPFVGPALHENRATITALEIGTRYSPTSGVVHPYFELAAGCGRHVSFEKTSVQNAPRLDGDFTTREYRATVDFALGGAWQPLQFPLGMFFEARVIGEPGRGGALWFAPHLGLLASRPSSR